MTIFITGAGLSAASGIPTFRHSPDAVWKGDVWTSATRGAWRKGSVVWWNDFWLKSFPLQFDGYVPNSGHEAIARIFNRSRGRVKVLTQNVDGLHQKTAESWNHKENLVEAHGRLGLYKCVPTEEQESEDNDLQQDIEDAESKKEDGSALEDEKRRRRKVTWCKYADERSVRPGEIVPDKVRQLMFCGGGGGGRGRGEGNCEGGRCAC
ncbi:hypothetical protein TL16_g00838 [Triparma laevis f. inornata]|uniref:Deacetylase sirtuin-type domain-containing protein n=1 Tax=Triparma laevis f. inornata TaxID=1714386 RepID=A0A9W6ZEE6_9STRA|nr:hypothetical protein TL16_g00838 [Triparma laevis f. inornata]